MANLALFLQALQVWCFAMLPSLNYAVPSAYMVFAKGIKGCKIRHAMLIACMRRC